ncbi:type IV pilin biogenesis protein [Moritella marina ATCC 15381]|uniref:Type IV pilin biogenesis protein n=1 Tax=Moritella marina ATCC 15381 TaxID=1202962 RepID=A0A5J6WQA5_MORMI|nr:PilC/PilY family type IV pilus protein [Moritella marina]QFI39115.1 type IV pilin biogenesis protein [Moritella marina ATCC 15381]
MKRIFKQASVALLGLTAFTAAADEGEIYTVNLEGKPQVLIILDTSAHMREEADYPYPKYYDPHIEYPPTPDTNAEDIVYRWLYGGEQFYYNNSATAQGLEHSELRSIAAKAVDTFTGGTALTTSEQEKYDVFVTTIPARNSSNKLDFSKMNCYSAVEDFEGDLGAFQDYVAQWLPGPVKLFDGVVGIPYEWRTIGSKTSIGRKFVDCDQDMATNEKRNPGYEHSGVIKPEEVDGEGESEDGSADGYVENPDREGFPSSGPEYYWNPYKDSVQGRFNGNSNNKAYLYSDNLVKWAALKPTNGDNIKLSNLQIAKKVVLDMMLDTTDLNTGLEIFNPNNAITKLNILDNNGGRVISKISSYDPEDYDPKTNDYKSKTSLLKSQVEDIFTTSMSKSALCESLYEGYRYLYGNSVYFGDDVYKADPARDLTAESGGVYNSPMDWVNSCQTEAYIIMVTAGYHDVSPRVGDIVPCGGIFNDLIRIDAFDHDSDANLLIERLPGMSALDIKDKSVQVNAAESSCDKNLLPVLSDWLANADMNSSTKDVKERIVTYTVGIGELPAGNRTLLEKTAEYGDGKFYNALNANELRKKLEMAFADIIARQKGVTAAVGTSINSSNSTKSNEFVYYTMFQPNQTSKWKGNIRKLKVTDDGQLSAWTQSASAASSLSSATSAALSTGDSVFFNDDLYSGWSSEQGLNDVELGGVVEAFKNRKSARNIYISNVDDTTLLPLTKANLLTALSVTTDADLANALGVSEDTLTAAIDWLQGKDETGDLRDDIFGDPMHAQPLIVEYPDNESADVKTKARIFIGTNAGFFHAFKDNGRNVEEEWAFIPKENLATALKLNLQVTRAEERIYGIDSSAVDAEYLDNGKTKHIITFGLRRGGNKYFSLNVNLDPNKSNTTEPTLNWIIDASNTDFSKLAQTWSTPVVSKVFRGDNISNAKPVLIFGGGYDASKDDCGSNSTAVPAQACTDSSGQAVYIIDADDGTKLKAFENGVITDSIASELAVMDSDGDGYADRIYAPDTAGNIYRVDMPKIFDVKTNQFTMDTSKWRIFKLASLGGTTADDRRFFSAPSIVRARESASSYDGLLLGSGDITSPNSNITAQNYFFNIKDSNIYPQVWGSAKGERAVPATIEMSNLNQVSYDSTTEKDTDTVIDYKTNRLHGWRYILNEATVEEDGKIFRGGEKSLGNAVVINGIVHFNTYSPFAINYVVKNGQCVVNQSGNSHYYQVNLNTGTTKYYQKLPNVIAKDLAVHAASSGDASVLRLLGAGKGDTTDGNGDQITPTGTIDTEVTLSPRPIYRYFNEAVQ